MHTNYSDESPWQQLEREAEERHVSQQLARLEQELIEAQAELPPNKVMTLLATDEDTFYTIVVKRGYKATIVFTEIR